MIGTVLQYVLGSHHIRHRTAGVVTGKKHPFIGVKYLRAFRHELYSAENYILLIGRFRLLCKLKAVAAEIRGVLNLYRLVVMSKDKRVLFFFQFVYFFGYCFNVDIFHCLDSFRLILPCTPYYYITTFSFFQ